MWDLRGALNVKPMVNGRQCRTIRGSNSWNAATLSGWGQSLAKLVVGRSTPRSKKGPTTEEDYAKGQNESPTTTKKEFMPREHEER